MDNSFSVHNREIIKDTLTLDEVWLPMRPVKLEKQFALEVVTEAIATRKKVTTHALVNSGCTRTCIDKTFAQEQGWPLERICHPILIEYADGTVTEESKIWYMVNLRIRMAGTTVVTEALVMRLKSFKVFLGFDWLQVVNPNINWQYMTLTILEGQAPLVMRSVESYTPSILKVVQRGVFWGGLQGTTTMKTVGPRNQT
jgi:hypothetical protein